MSEATGAVLAAEAGPGVRRARPLNLALQGGGAHGAFTWGVLDRLLEDGRFAAAGISGTSAGAVNAVCLADGLLENGAEGARDRLHAFWRELGRRWRWNPAQRGLWQRFMGGGTLAPPFASQMFDVLARFWSPYELNPLGYNSLLDLIREAVDFDRLRAADGMDVFVSATDVRTGQVRIFARHEMTAEAVMASACLPHLFQAVEIDGIPYWDGGFADNPGILPLVEANSVADILLVQLNPLERPETPRTARQIARRVDEVAFNASLLRELRTIDLMNRLAEEGRLRDPAYAGIRLHRIGGDAALRDLPAGSKTHAEWGFLLHLRNLGRAAAQDWLDGAAADVGRRSGIDIRREAPAGTVPRPVAADRPGWRRLLAVLRRALGDGAQSPLPDGGDDRPPRL